jgi:hypothetical protein
VWKNNSQLAAFLLENGADTEIRDEAGLTALHVDILRICMERMRHVPLLRSQCVHSNSSVCLLLLLFENMGILTYEI